MKLFLVYGVDKYDNYPLIKLYGVFSSMNRASNFIGRQRKETKNDNEGTSNSKLNNKRKRVFTDSLSFDIS